MRISKYFPFVFIYFFVNSIFLPFGLTYTSLLAPLFYIWILLVRKKEILLPFLLVLMPFLIIQLSSPLDSNAYFVSLLNILLVYIFCQAAYTFLVNSRNLERIFKQILLINFGFCCLAILLYSTPLANLLWMDQNVTVGLNHFRRMNLLTYEPSYYAMLWIPFFAFFFLQFLLHQNRMNSAILLGLIFLPFILSFSIGVIGALLIAGILTHLIYFKRLTRKRRIFNLAVYSLTVLTSGLLIAVVFFRHNPLFARLLNIFSGSDTSGKGRTFDAFVIAQKILKQTNEVWGAGIGQVKIAGADIIRSYYLYSPDFPVAIPNAAAETLAIFGWVGFSLRVLLELGLFFYTKVWSNYYRLLLFLFMFIYQFTGSFITNGAEYVIWIFAFTNVFRQFDVPGLKATVPRRFWPQPVL